MRSIAFRTCLCEFDNMGAELWMEKSAGSDPTSGKCGAILLRQGLSGRYTRHGSTGAGYERRPVLQAFVADQNYISSDYLPGLRRFVDV
jgi:hypothetical protein